MLLIVRRLNGRVMAAQNESGSGAVCAAFAEPWPKLDVEELALRANVEVAPTPCRV